MTSEKYEFEYCNLVKANEAANKHAIARQYEMIADIRQLQSENVRLKEACQACVNIIGIKDITTAKKLCEQALKGM